MLERERTDVDMELPPICLKLQATPCLVNKFSDRGRNSETAWSPQPWELEQRTIRCFPEDNHSRWVEKQILLNEVRRGASVDHVIGRILMAILLPDGTFHAVDQEETLRQ